MSIEKKKKGGRSKVAPIAASVAALAVVAGGVYAFAGNKNGGGDSTPSSSPNASNTTQPVASGPVEGGTLRYLAAQEPPVWYNQGNNPLSLLSIESSVYDTVLTQAQDGSYHPGLAELPEISEDGLEYTFTFKQGVKFHDGEPFNAEAFAANITALFIDFPNTSVPITAVEVVDEYTAKIILSRPNGATVHFFSTPHFPVVSPKVLAEHDASELIGSPLFAVGTGPFKVESYVKGSSLTLVRNDDYNWAPEIWGRQGKAYLDRIEISFVAEPEIRVNSLLAGQADAIDSVPPINADQVTANSSLVILEADNAGVPYTVQLNTNVAPFDDIRVREAVRSAIDVEGILQSIYKGYYNKAWTILSPNTPPVGAYQSSLEGSWNYDKDAALALLAEAGYTERDSEGYLVRDGQRLTLSWKDDSGYINADQRAQLGQAIVANLKDAGIEVVVTQYETASYKDELAKNTHHFAPSSRGYADGGIAASVFWSNLSLLNNPNGINYGLTADENIDANSIVISTNSDFDTRAEAARNIQQIVHDEVYAIPLYVAKKLVGTHDYVNGWDFDAVGYTDTFYNVWLDK